MELTVLERMNLIGLLPKEGTALLARTIVGLRKKVGLDPADLERIGVVLGEGKTITEDDTHANFSATLSFEEIEKDVIAEVLRKRDKQGTLPVDCMIVGGLWDKFVNIPPEEPKEEEPNEDTELQAINSPLSGA